MIEQITCRQTKHKHDQEKYIDKHSVPVSKIRIRRHLDARRQIQYTVNNECQQTCYRTCAVQIITFVKVRRMRTQGRHDTADYDAEYDRSDQSCERKATRLKVWIAEHQLTGKRCQRSRKHCDISNASKRNLLDPGVYPYSEKERPDIGKCHTERGEPYIQPVRRHRQPRTLRLCKIEQTAARQPDHSCI